MGARALRVSEALFSRLVGGGEHPKMVVGRRHPLEVANAALRFACDQCAECVASETEMPTDIAITTIRTLEILEHKVADMLLRINILMPQSQQEAQALLQPSRAAEKTPVDQITQRRQKIPGPLVGGVGSNRRLRPKVAAPETAADGNSTASTPRHSSDEQVAPLTLDTGNAVAHVTDVAQSPANTPVVGSRAVEYQEVLATADINDTTATVKEAQAREAVETPSFSKLPPLSVRPQVSDVDSLPSLSTPSRELSTTPQTTAFNAITALQNETKSVTENPQRSSAEDCENTVQPEEIGGGEAETETGDDDAKSKDADKDHTADKKDEAADDENEEEEEDDDDDDDEDDFDCDGDLKLAARVRRMSSKGTLDLEQGFAVKQQQPPKPAADPSRARRRTSMQIVPNAMLLAKVAPVKREAVRQSGMTLGEKIHFMRNEGILVTKAGEKGHARNSNDALGGGTGWHRLLRRSFLGKTKASAQTDRQRSRLDIGDLWRSSTRAKSTDDNGRISIHTSPPWIMKAPTTLKMNDLTDDMISDDLMVSFRHALDSPPRPPRPIVVIECNPPPKCVATNPTCTNLSPQHTGGRACSLDAFQSSCGTGRHGRG